MIKLKVQRGREKLLRDDFFDTQRPATEPVSEFVINDNETTVARAEEVKEKGATIG